MIELEECRPKGSNTADFNYGRHEAQIFRNKENILRIEIDRRIPRKFADAKIFRYTVIIVCLDHIIIHMYISK